MSIPAGFDAKGLPVGLQLIGQYFGEEKLLNVAHLYQQATDWHRQFRKGSDSSAVFLRRCALSPHPSYNGA